MKKYSSSSLGLAAALLIAFETIIFGFPLIWEIINQSELARITFSALPAHKSKKYWVPAQILLTASEGTRK